MHQSGFYILGMDLLDRPSLKQDNNIIIIIIQLLKVGYKEIVKKN